MSTTVRAIWNDAVWSKVIASGLFAVLLVVGTYLLQRWPVIEAFLMLSIPLAYVVVSVPVIAGLTYRQTQIKSRIGEKQQLPEHGFDRVFEPNNSLEFYSTIADVYDKGNTEELRKTHRAVITEIKKHTRGISGDVVILDIGGGTGQLIANQFYDSNRFKWIYVDACSRMADKFRDNMTNVPLRSKIHVATLADVCETFTPKSDVIVMSFLISSLPEIPDFLGIAGLLKEGGVLIVAEADPAYSTIRPYYDLHSGKESVALKINPVHHLELKSRCEYSGLLEVSIQPTRKKELIYSYVAVYKKPLQNREKPV